MSAVRVAVTTGTDGAERIASMVSEECAVSVRAPDSDADVDLWIADERTVEKIDARTDAGTDPAIVLVTDDGRVPTDCSPEVDDIVARPLRTSVVRRRIETVLDAHALRTGGRADRVEIDCVAHPVVAARIEAGERIVQSVNDAFEDVFGYDADAVVGDSLAEWVARPDDRAAVRELVNHVRDGDAIERVCRRETATGHRQMRVKMHPSSERGTDVLVCYDDITSERRRKQQVQVLNRVLRHNLRNTMNVILGNADVLNERVDGPVAAEATETIEAAANDLVKLGETASSLQTAREERERRVLEATCLVDRVRTQLRRELPRVDLRIEAAESCPVLADAHLETAVRELCENAARYAGADGPIVVSIDRRGNWTQISVRDSGPGLPETERAVLRGDEETPLEHGSGLGLWIVNWIVTSLGGEIAVEDAEPTGTVVTLSLPAGPHRSDRPPSDACH
ncbi:PAS domain S-box-containing protein [Natronoarchaeum philippinense]|uniref:histidine kinase n=1 Tax=Natronoarchaeum philippinense TaxID=558529 RepID=A0A285NAC0_NATPI|nr:PAS domain S-box-containing protein [Natronoarchaeum philippinense]